MHHRDIRGQQVLNPIFVEGMYMAAANLHQGERPIATESGNLSDHMTSQGCIVVFIYILHESRSFPSKLHTAAPMHHALPQNSLSLLHHDSRQSHVALVEASVIANFAVVPPIIIRASPGASSTQNNGAGSASPEEVAQSASTRPLRCDSSRNSDVSILTKCAPQSPGLFDY